MPGPRLSFNSLYAVAKKEFMDNVRNKWIIALVLIFVLLTVLASYLAAGQQADGAGDGALGNMEETVLVLISISSILVPIIAIMLGYATISGETESGALHVVLAYPVRRLEVLLGKFLGLGMVIVVATVGGFGLGGIIIAAVAGGEAIGGFLAFIGLTILLGLLFLSMAILFSAICKRRSTSIAAGVLLFFWGMIIGMIIFGIYYATGGSFEELFSGTGNFPNWLWAMEFLSPMDMTQIATMQSFGLSGFMGYNLEVPGFVSVGSIVLVQVVWMLMALTLAYYFFRKRDI